RRSSDLWEPVDSRAEHGGDTHVNRTWPRRGIAGSNHPDSSVRCMPEETGRYTVADAATSTAGRAHDADTATAATCLTVAQATRSTADPDRRRSVRGEVAR